MIIEKLTMFNFGPFFGEHSLELSVSSSAPVILVYGENMRGKTSLQNAIGGVCTGTLSGEEE